MICRRLKIGLCPSLKYQNLTPEPAASETNLLPTQHLKLLQESLNICEAHSLIADALMS